MNQKFEKLNKLLIENHILLFILGLMYGYLLMFPLVGFKIDLTKNYYMSVFVGYIALISLLVYTFAVKVSKSIDSIIKQFQNEYLNIALTELKTWEEELKKRLKKYEKRFKSKRTTNHKSCGMVAELNTILKELKKIQKKLKS